MTTLRGEVFEAFRAIDVPEDKAMKAATALSKRDDELYAMKTDLLLVKRMLGFVLAFQVAMFSKMFLH